MIRKQANHNTCYASLDQAVCQLRAGRMVLICDDETREHEADLCLAAQFVTADAINFLMHQACGLICVALAGERLDALGIPLAPKSQEVQEIPNFTISVDAAHGITSGINAQDRAQTIKMLMDLETRPDDLVSPGHVFPLRACPKGTLERRGHTEASVDLMRIAELSLGAVLCETLDERGEVVRGPALEGFAYQWNLPIITVDAIARQISADSAAGVALEVRHEW
jgi:3,4-dihydroxy 2-butanone 4-phosphate synthase/GTP cyclohydrolase II